MLRIVILISFLFVFVHMKAENISYAGMNSTNAHENIAEANFSKGLQLNSPNRVLLSVRQRLKDSRKLTAAIMAFPLPFGIVGMHRIYFGTKPYVPVLYIATVGGCFGILPLIDFFVILFEKDLEQFANNPRVFMWAK